MAGHAFERAAGGAEGWAAGKVFVFECGGEVGKPKSTTQTRRHGEDQENCEPLFRRCGPQERGGLQLRRPICLAHRSAALMEPVQLGSADSASSPFCPISRCSFARSCARCSVLNSRCNSSRARATM